MNLEDKMEQCGDSGEDNKKKEELNEETIRNLISEYIEETQDVHDLAQEIMRISEQRNIEQSWRNRYANLQRELQGTRMVLFQLIGETLGINILEKETDEERKKARDQLLLKLVKEKPHWVNPLGFLLHYADKKKATENKVPCENLIEKCKGACCSLPFVLTREEILEGKVEWDENLPFRIKHENGMCVHFKEETKKCNIYENRPIVCRTYSCERDGRIWKDYDKQVLNPNLDKSKEKPENEVKK